MNNDNDVLIRKLESAINEIEQDGDAHHVQAGALPIWLTSLLTTIVQQGGPIVAKLIVQLLQPYITPGA